MKRKILLIVTLFTLFVVSSNAKREKVWYQPELSITGQAGYSLINGIVGAEIQIYNIAMSVSYFPANFPTRFSGFSDMNGSISVAATYYHGGVEKLGSGIFDSGLYASFGVASKTYEFGDYYHESPLPMAVAITGFRVLIGKYYYMKVGVGVGATKNRFTPTGEATIGFMFTWY